MAIVEEKVKPGRGTLTKNAIGRKRAKFWWQFGSTAKELYLAVAGLERVLVISRISNTFAFTFLPAGMVYNEKTYRLPVHTVRTVYRSVQSRLHELCGRGSCPLRWGTTLQYTPSDCFETFPFPRKLGEPH